MTRGLGAQFIDGPRRHAELQLEAFILWQMVGQWNIFAQSQARSLTGRDMPAVIRIIAPDCQQTLIA